MPIIRPITDLRNTNEISELCHSRQEPVFITKNGYGDLVVMSMETYEKNFAEQELLEKIMEAENDRKNGVKYLTGAEVFGGLREKYGQKSV
ncbi:MAG: type II toxin-antitoxin system Phd/YefM family antitoxin [Clostridiales bacterium]|nr:type II toxin-antitoxin system Phd/YefM family antitoxin [Clostridiales bacterium]